LIESHRLIRRREERKKRLIGLFETLKERFYEIADEELVKIKNKDVYYVKKYSMLVPDTKRKACSRERFEPEFAGYKGRLLSYDEAKDLFYKNRNRNQLVENNEIINDKEKIFSERFDRPARLSTWLGTNVGPRRADFYLHLSHFDV